MSANPGKVAPFPPLPGQPYPPARNHPRWKEIYRLHDDWLMKYWPFSSEQKRARIPFMNLAGFSTWCAPAADFDRMVWGARLGGVFFLADDYVDTGKMWDRIPGFKQAATGTGPLHPGDRAEICHDIVFRAIKATCQERTFNQLTKCTHEWWDSNGDRDFHNLDDYLSLRRVNIAMYFANAYFRYTLDVNLTDEQVNHPLMREAEGIVSDHVGLVNDLFSYAKERLTNSDDTNIVRLLQEHCGLTYEQSKLEIEQKIRERERAYIPAGLAVLNHPELGQDSEVRRWIACLPYCMGGNLAWSQESGRYNLGNIPGSIPFPRVEFAAEETPADEAIDDTVESQLRARIFDVKDTPLPDLSLDVSGIESQDSHHSGLPLTLAIHTSNKPRPRPEDVGILAIEVCHEDCAKGSDCGCNIDCQDLHLRALAMIRSLITKYDGARSAGRIEFVSTRSNTSCTWFRRTLVTLFGEPDIEIFDRINDPATALFSATNWIEGSFWDGRYAIIVSCDGIQGNGTAAILVGPMAPIVLEPFRGTNNYVKVENENGESLAPGVAAFFDCYTRYNSHLHDFLVPRTPPFAESTAPWYDGHSVNFDYLIHDCAELEFLPQLADIADCVIPVASIAKNRRTFSACIYGGLASVVGLIPGYELFEKRVSIFTHNSDASSTFFVLWVKGDTKPIWENLKAIRTTTHLPWVGGNVRSAFLH